MNDPLSPVVLINHVVDSSFVSQGYSYDNVGLSYDEAGVYYGQAGSSTETIDIVPSILFDVPKISVMYDIAL